LIDRILERSSASRPSTFNHAIRRLWDSYQRPMAAQLVRVLAEHHADAPIAQYWLAQVQGVEPALARQVFDEEFLQSHFQPQVAHSCGSAG